MHSCSPIDIVLKMVPATAMRRMVPRWSKKSLLGMKYPASRMIGGSMKRKKMSGVSVVGGSSLVRNNKKPMMIPT